MFENIKVKISKAICTFDYGTKCHGYAPDGQHAHFSRCYDNDCPNQIQENEFYNPKNGKWEVRID